MSIVKNIFVDQNSNWEKTYTLYDQNRLPFDLTNYSARADIKKYHNTANVASFMCEILNPPTLGKIVLSLDYNDLQDIKPGIYQYDILLTTIDNVKIRAVQGSVDISGNITE